MEIGPPLLHSGPVEVVVFLTDGLLLTRGPGGMVRRRALPPAAQGGPDRALFWIQALTGAELTSEGVIAKVAARPSDPRAIPLWQALLATREKGVPSVP